MKWTDDKLSFLKENYSNTDNNALEEKLKISRGYITKKANDLGLLKNRETISQMRKKNNPQTYWSEDQIKFIKDNYKFLSNKEIVNKINSRFNSKFTVRQLKRKIGRLGIIRTKKQVDNIRSKIIKERLTDLSFEHVFSCAKKYNTKQEFYLKDPNAYNKVLKMGWKKEVFKHMVVGNFSIPQLMLRNILETLLNEKCSYNNRSIITPLEIDIYFEKWKIGWEYDGRRFHKHPDDKNKIEKCLKKGVKLFNIHEFTDDFKKYELNIKNQLKRDLFLINEKTGLNLKKEHIDHHVFQLKFPNQLTIEEKKLVFNKKMSDIKKVDLNLFNKVKKYKIYNEEILKIENDLPKCKKFSSHIDYISYLKKQNYSNFSDLCTKEHPHRLMKKWNQPIDLIHEIFNK